MLRGAEGRRGLRMVEEGCAEDAEVRRSDEGARRGVQRYYEMRIRGA